MVTSAYCKHIVILENVYKLFEESLFRGFILCFVLQLLQNDIHYYRGTKKVLEYWVELGWNGNQSGKTRSSHFWIWKGRGVTSVDLQRVVLDYALLKGEGMIKKLSTWPYQQRTTFFWTITASKDIKYRRPKWISKKCICQKGIFQRWIFRMCIFEAYIFQSVCFKGVFFKSVF